MQISTKYHTICQTNDSGRPDVSKFLSFCLNSCLFNNASYVLFLSLSTDFVKESSTTYFFCEGSQLRWDWLLDRARAYTCLRWPRPQVSQNESVDFICWWTISGLVVKAILRTGGATTQQPSSMREQSVWLEPILSYQTTNKQISNKFQFHLRSECLVRTYLLLYICSQFNRVL